MSKLEKELKALKEKLKKTLKERDRAVMKLVKIEKVIGKGVVKEVFKNE